MPDADLQRFRAGDKVHHNPSGENWILAAARGDFVYPCGWPETRAEASDCVLLVPATDAQHREMIEEWSNKRRSAGIPDERVSISQDQLFDMNQGFIGEGI